MTVHQAYFDESDREGGVFCVAGYVFASEQARKFSKEWLHIFGDYGGLHMREFLHSRGRFKGMSEVERDRMLREAVNVINQRMTVGVAISCYIQEINACTPKFIRGYGHAYPVCCHLAMLNAVIGLNEANYSGSISYIFEAGHSEQPEALDFVKTAAYDELKATYRYHAHSFLPKCDAIPLQAADLLAWEWAKFQDETLDQRKRHMRKSLRALFAHAPKRYKVAHCGGEVLRNYMGNVRKCVMEGGAPEVSGIES